MTNEKEQIKNYLATEYNRLAYTHSYVFGTAIGGMVYAARVEDGRELVHTATYIDRSSSKNGGTFSLKYRPNAGQWAAITAQASEVKAICSAEYLENLFKNNKHNRGQIFEELVANAFGGELETKSNLKFTEGGDMNLNGKAYQVKYTKATFTDERTLMNLRG